MNKNRRKKQRKFSVTEIVVLALAAVILMVGGVTHAWLKNSHVEVIREIDNTERRIRDHQGAIDSLQVKMDKNLNIYQLRADLENTGSSLVQVPPSSIEVIPPYSASDRHVVRKQSISSLARTDTP